MTVRGRITALVCTLAVGVLSGCASATQLPPVVPQLAPVAADPLDIQNAVTALADYLSGAALNGGSAPSPTSILTVAAADARISGRLILNETLGKGSYSTVRVVNVVDAGNPGTVSITIRNTSSHPANIIDVLHRPGNRGHDYLLTGDGFRAAIPTPWVTIPAEYGNGLGCLVPGRREMCEVAADVTKNLQNDPQPSDSVTRAGGVSTVNSTITLRQLLALTSWRMSSSATSTLVKSLTPAQLDHSRIAVVLKSASGTGRSPSMSVNGALTVSGQRVSVDIRYAEGNFSPTDVSLPVPSRPLYSPLTDAGLQQLRAVVAAGE